MEINYVVTIFPGQAVADPSPEELFREQYYAMRAEEQRHRSKITAGPTDNAGRLDAEREINNVRAYSQS
jgi:hypothetical protein